MIKLFGHQLFFDFKHYIYSYNLNDQKTESTLSAEIVVSNIEDVNMGYFSLNMLRRVLEKNPEKTECYLFRDAKAEKVGFALLSFRGAREIHYRIRDTDAFITALGVFPSQRGKGFSQEILQSISSICIKRGFHVLKLAVDQNNHIAINSYEKFGFIKQQSKHFYRVLGVDFLLDKKV